MARNFNGGTDQITWYDAANMNSVQYETVSFWFKTTQNATNVHLASLISNTSRNGWLIYMSSGIIYCVGYAATAQRFAVTSGATTYNDGNWHHLVWTIRRSAFAGNVLYVDGVNIASGNPTGDWYTYTGYYAAIGDSFDAFWGTFVGDIAEFAHWRNTLLSADHAVALAKGFSPRNVYPQTIDIYAPLYRDARSIASPSRTPAGIVSVTGTTVVNHPRIIG